jgi:AraC-like DNA-binding protein
MEPIEAALQDLNLQDKPNISATAKLYSVERSTLSRRFNHVSTSTLVKHQNQQLLQPQQEADLIEYINQLTEKGIHLTTSMVRNFAEEISRKEPGKNWSQRFCKKN